MGINEKIKKINELLAEVNKLAEEITSEHKTFTLSIDTVLADYISDAQSVEISNFWLNEDGDVEEGVCDYISGNYNPYCNYMRKDYANTAAKLKKFNDILLAFKWCYEKDYQPDWASDAYKYRVYYNCEASKYDVCIVNTSVVPTIYFDGRNIADKCAEFLTNIDPKGEFLI